MQVGVRAVALFIPTPLRDNEALPADLLRRDRAVTEQVHPSHVSLSKVVGLGGRPVTRTAAGWPSLSSSRRTKERSMSRVREAAAEIVQLINTSPRSPRQDEVEAIIAKAVPPAIGGDDAIVRRWEAAEAAHYAVAAQERRGIGRTARVSQRRADRGDAASSGGSLPGAGRMSSPARRSRFIGNGLVSRMA